MKAEDTFTLEWCKKHSNWFQYNCPDCRVDSNEEDIKRAGIKEVVEWVRANALYIHPENERWRAKLKEWGIE